MKHKALLFVLLVIVCSGVAEEPVCQDTTYGRYCTRIFPTRMTLADGALLLVGGNNSLYSFNTLPRLELKEQMILTPDNETRDACMRQREELECQNMIRIVQSIPQEALQGNLTLQSKFNDTVLVCGTNAFSPKCLVHKRTEISSATSLIDRDHEFEGFSPFSIHSQNIGLLATNGKFYTGSVFGKILRRNKVAISLGPLHGDVNFPVATLDTNPLWILQDSNTKFISMYEIRDHIYIFFKESAYEVNVGRSVVYSRVIRICKSDVGIDDIQQTIRRFQTFQKIRIACPHSDTSSSALPYYYNDITSTYLYWPEGSDLPYLYATFTSPVNAPEGSALCKFSFDEADTQNLVKGFTEGIYYEFNETTLVMQKRGDFSCPGAASGTQRTEDLAKKDQLAVGIALPIGENAVLTSDGETYIHTAVDVFMYNNTKHEVIYITTDDGHIKAFIRKSGESSKLLFNVFMPTKSSSDNSITQLILAISNDTKARRLYATTNSLLVDISFGNCSKYGSCISCLESKDPYCAWQRNECVNKLSTPYALGQTVEATNPPVNIPNFCGVSNSSDVIVTHSTVMSTIITPSEMSTTSSISYVTSTTSTHVFSTTTSITSKSTQIPTFSSTVTSTVRPTPHDMSTSIKSTTATTGLPILTPTPSVGGFGTLTSKPPIVEIVGALAGGLLLGFVVGLIVCCIGLRIKHTLMKDTTPVHNTNADRHTHSNGSVGQYKISVMFPEGSATSSPTTSNEEEPQFEKRPPSSISPTALDIEQLEDDVISDLPTNISPMKGHGNKWSVPRGRTESTRWLRASESESMSGNESPQPPL